jgi:hypothetical protein
VSVHQPLWRTPKTHKKSHFKNIFCSLSIINRIQGWWLTMQGSSYRHS